MRTGVSGTVVSVFPAVNGSRTAVALDGNEMPLPVPTAVRRAARAALAEISMYPGPGAPRLRQILADRYDVSPDWLVVGAGSVDVIAQVMTSVGPGHMVTPWPGFEAVPQLAAGRGLSITFTGLDGVTGACDLAAARVAVRPSTSLIIICTPHSPTGGTLTHSSLTEFLAEIPPHTTVLIDQAYAEFASHPDPPRPVELATSHPRAMVTRTFSKAYGLAGLRVGYGLANPGLVSSIAASAVPYTVTAAAEAAAVEALRRPSDLAATVARIRAERARLAQALAVRGAEVVVGHGNFVWLPRGDGVSEVVEHLASAGFLVKGYPGDGIRVSVGTREDTVRLARAWPDRSRACPPAAPG
jgi:histidinol-phosphate aminotransferase